jgi:arsenite methyltransferase
LADLLEETGFAVAKLEQRQHVHHHATPATAIKFSEASSFGNYLGHLPEALRAAARRDIEHALEELRTPDGIRQSGERIIAVAIKRPGAPT